MSVHDPLDHDARRACVRSIEAFGPDEEARRVAAWAEALVQRPSTHSFPPAEYEAMYRDMVKRRNKWMSQFVDGAAAAAE